MKLGLSSFCWRFLHESAWLITCWPLPFGRATVEMVFRYWFYPSWIDSVLNSFSCVYQMHSLIFKCDLFPQYIFGEFSADEINQFFVTPRCYVEVRELRLDLSSKCNVNVHLWWVACASEDARCSSTAGQHDGQYSLHRQKIPFILSQISTKLIFFSDLFSSSIAKIIPYFLLAASPIQWQGSMCHSVFWYVHFTYFFCFDSI